MLLRKYNTRSESPIAGHSERIANRISNGRRLVNRGAAAQQDVLNHRAVWRSHAWHIKPPAGLCVVACGHQRKHTTSCRIHYSCHTWPRISVCPSLIEIATCDKHIVVVYEVGYG